MQKEFTPTVKSVNPAQWASPWFLVVCWVLPLINTIAQPVGDRFETLMSEPRHYPCIKTLKPVNCDGILDDEAWRVAPWSEPFLDIEGNSRPVPNFKTQAKMVWDDSFLYIAAELEEDNIWAYLVHHDDIVYRENDFEIFISNEPQSQQYYEIEINALETVFDLLMPKPYRDGGRPMIDWNPVGIETRVHLDGTINSGYDKDKGWVIEMKIPFSALHLDGTGQQPKTNDTWRINFSRVEYQAGFTDGKYVKNIDPSSGLPFLEHNWVWSPQGLINMHYPERWGYLTFLDNGTTPGSGPSFNYSTEEKLKQQLWRVYYLQKETFKNNRKYATSLRELGYETETMTIDECPVQLTMIATTEMFLASVRCDKKNIQFLLNNGGQLQPSR